MEALDSLGKWPILQFAAAILIVMGAAYAIFRGLKDRSRAETPLPSEQRWFFDGPLAEAPRYLRESAKLLELQLAELRPLGEAIRTQNRILEEMKRSIDDLPSRWSRRQE